MPWWLWNIIFRLSVYTNSNISFVNSWIVRFLVLLHETRVCKDGSTDTVMVLQELLGGDIMAESQSHFALCAGPPLRTPRSCHISATLGAYMTSIRVYFLWLLSYFKVDSDIFQSKYLKLWLFLSKRQIYRCPPKLCSVWSIWNPI